MTNTRQIKRRIGAASNISKITKAMEMVAASKMKKAQDQATSARPYARALHSSLQKVSAQINPEAHPLLSVHDTGIPILIILSTNKGLCGNLNAQLFKNTMSWLEQNENGEVIAIGKKAVHFCRLAGLNLHAQFTDLPEKITSGDVLPITQLISDGFLEKKFKQIDIVFMDFINTLSQQVRRTRLLPLSKELTYDQNFETKPAGQVEYQFEPNARALLAELLPYYIENAVFQAFLEARASEHSARMVTMKNASENATSLVGELQLEFNKSRQASITNELLDITTASLTLQA